MMPYTKANENWQDSPSIDTPITAAALEQIETGIATAQALAESANASGVAGALADHLADATDAHDASAISVLDAAGNYAATDVEGVLAEVGATVGLFSTLAATAPVIGPLVLVVATSGYASAGVGGGSYVYDAAVDAAYVTANPRVSFLAADSRGFRLIRKAVNPFQFGCLGDGAADDAVPLQAFFDFIAAWDVGTADASGAFRSSVAITFGNVVPVVPRTLAVDGNFLLTMTGTGRFAFTITEWDTGVWNGPIKVTGSGTASTFTSRGWEVGVVLNNVSTAVFSRIRAATFSYAGVMLAPRIDPIVGNISDLTALGSVKSTDCGSGYSNGNYSAKADWSNPVRNGSSGDIGQTTTIDVTTVPPSYIGSTGAGGYGAVADAVYLARITEADGTKRLHYIKAVGASTINVYPWIHSTAVPGTLEYVWGGGLVLMGADANVITFSVVDATRCGIGLNAGSLYGPIGHSVVTHACGIGISWNRDPGGASYGGKIDGAYFESNTHDVFHIGISTNGWGIIDNEYALDLAQYEVLGPRLTGDLLSSAFRDLEYGRISKNGRSMQWEKKPFQSSPSDNRDITRPDMFVPITADTTTLGALLNINVHRLMGYDTVRYLVTGTGTNGTPTGTITFNVPTAGQGITWTLNGGAIPVAFSDLQGGPAEFLLTFDTDPGASTGNAIVTHIGAGLVSKAQAVNNQTGTTYTLVLADVRKTLEMNNAGAIALTVPTNATVAFPVGTIIDVYQQGAGQVTVSGAGVTFVARVGLKTVAQHGVIRLWKRATNTWVVTGDAAA